MSAYLNINIIENWSEIGNQVFQWSLQKVVKNPDSEKWYSYLPIETTSNTLIGSCGFKGAPGENGTVEIGYEVTEKFRNKGYATEIVGILIKIAFDDIKVTKILAHTLANENASVKVLKRCDFKFVKELNDSDDGLIWQWIKEK